MSAHFSNYLQIIILDNYYSNMLSEKKYFSVYKGKASQKELPAVIKC